jgi:hypothetical protein
MTILQARKPCGCVTAVCCDNGSVDAAHADKFRKEYEYRGYTIERVRKVCPTMKGTCTHGPIEEQIAEVPR